MKSAVTIAAVNISPLPKIAALLIGLLLAACGSPMPEKAGNGPVVLDAHSRETAPGATAGVVYLRIESDAAADRLLGIRSDVAARTEIHETTLDGGVMRMRPVQALDIAAGTTVEFEPGGLHVMLLDLRRELRAGDTFDVTLNFERAGPMPVTVHVRSLD